MAQAYRQNLRLTLISGVFAFSYLTLGPNYTFAQADKKAPAQADKKAPAPSEPIKPPPVPTDVGRSITYKPPLRGNPTGRGGGGTRSGSPERSVVLSVLTPDHVGLTIQEQPSLFWYASQITSYLIELTIIENQAAKPLLETYLIPLSQPGIQRIRLEDYNVRLRMGAQYRWSVAIIPDPKNRYKDILAGGFIERVEATDSLRARLAQASAEQSAFVYAEEGIWYDALSILSEMIAANPSDSNARSQRATLLEQVRLNQVADFDRRSER